MKIGELTMSHTAFDAVIILPPGSTSTDLQVAINNATSGDVIVITDDINFTDTVTIPAGKTITIQSDMLGRNIPFTLISSAGSGWLFTVFGQLLLKDIILDGNNQRAGVIVTGSSASFIMEEGVTITRGLTNQGGGVRVADGASFYMEGGKISGNTATNQGGGVFVINGSSFRLINGEISGNRATGGGSIAGGVAVRGGSTFIMSSGSIIDNYANGYGGGVYLQDPGNSFAMAGGAINGNTAVNQGGGVFISAGNSFTMTGGEINENQVTELPSYGGGVIVYNATFYMTNGAINGNSCTYAGGGVFVGETDGSTLVGFGNFTMTGGTINGNTALAGGGVFVRGTEAVFTMNGGSITENSAEGNNGGGVYLLSGTFNMGNGTNSRPILSDNTATGSGGGVMIYSYRTGGEKSIFTMYDGVIRGNAAASGGGIAVYSGTFFAMYGGVVGGGNAGQANTATGNGGGIGLFAADSTFVMYGGAVMGNRAGRNGGGAYVQGTTTDKSTFTMTGGAIAGNQAGNNGGGVYITDTGIFIMTSGEISGNSAPDGDGGGIYVERLGSVNISGSSFILNNAAPIGSGGGIYTADYTDYAALTEFDYQNLTIANTVFFSGNIASQAYLPPAIAASYTNIRYASTSLISSSGYIHPINNYDINYVGSEPLVFYYVIYDANGGIGRYEDINILYGTQYRILSPNETGISREGYTFTSWNTQPDGSGVAYAPGNLIIVTNNIILYAQWTANEVPSYKPPCFIPCCKLCCKPCYNPLCNPWCALCCKSCRRLCGKPYCRPCLERQNAVVV